MRRRAGLVSRGKSLKIDSAPPPWNVATLSDRWRRLLGVGFELLLGCAALELAVVVGFVGGDAEGGGAEGGGAGP